MEGRKIIQTITKLFKDADELDWPQVRAALAGEILLDYTSILGGLPILQTPLEITKAWDAFLSSFDKTRHQLSGFWVKLHGQQAEVDYSGKTDYFVNGEEWSISGVYHVILNKQDDQWLITALICNYDSQSLGSALPQQVKENLNKLPRY